MLNTVDTYQRSGKEEELSELYQRLAAHEHTRWSDWMIYLFKQCRENKDGSVTIPKALVERWREQAGKDYEELTLTERKSDQEQVDRGWGDILRAISNIEADCRGDEAEKSCERHTQNARVEARREIRYKLAEHLEFLTNTREQLELRDMDVPETMMAQMRTLMRAIAEIDKRNGERGD